MRHLAIVLVLASSVASPALADGPERMRAVIELSHPSVRWVDAPTLARWLEESQVILFDARAPEEHRVSHLRGAVRIDPDREDLSHVTAPRTARVVVYCSVGARSADVAERLARAGFRDVYNLEGGIFGWANAGRPVYRGEQPVRAVHPYDAVWGRMLDPRLHAYRP